jgi:hypothetical protein
MYILALIDLFYMSNKFSTSLSLPLYLHGIALARTMALYFIEVTNGRCLSLSHTPRPKFIYFPVATSEPQIPSVNVGGRPRVIYLFGEARTNARNC